MKYFLMGLAALVLLVGVGWADDAVSWPETITADTQVAAAGVPGFVAGVVLDASTNASIAVLKDGTSTGTTLITIKGLATDNGQSQAVIFGAPIPFQAGLYVDETNCTSVTVLRVIPPSTAMVKVTYSGSGITIRDKYTGLTKTWATSDSGYVSARFWLDEELGSREADWALAEW
jgi:hypothetical protein